MKVVFFPPEIWVFPIIRGLLVSNQGLNIFKNYNYFILMIAICGLTEE